MLSSQTVWELLPAQDFCFRGDNYITKKMRVVCLAWDMPTGPSLHFYQTLSKYVWVSKLWSAQDFGFRGDNCIMKKNELSPLHKTHLLVLLFISTKYYQNMSKAKGIKVMECTRLLLKDFCFRVDNYIMKKVRVVYLARNTHTGPPLHPYQILSYNLKQYGSYCLHKISASGEITT